MRGATPTLAAPAWPQVNLLPPEIREARTLGVVKRWMLVSVGVTTVAVGTVAGVAQVLVAEANAQLVEAEAETAALLAENQPLGEVVRVQGELETVRTAREYGLATEILWSDYLGAITAVLPPGVRVTTLDYTGQTPLTAAAPSADPLIPAGIGAVSFTALSADLPDVAAWADALDDLPGFRDVRVKTTELQHRGSGLEYSVSGTIQVDDGALAHRFSTQAEDQS